MAGFLSKKQYAAIADKEFAIKKGEKTYQVLEFLLPIFLRRNKDMEL